MAKRSTELNLIVRSAQREKANQQLTSTNVATNKPGKNVPIFCFIYIIPDTFELGLACGRMLLDLELNQCTDQSGWATPTPFQIFKETAKQDPTKLQFNFRQLWGFRIIRTFAGAAHDKW